jgi:glutamyl-tRNA reductase
MTLITLGINHRTAPVELREQVAFGDSQLPAALRELAALPGVSEAAILSTCNRTEVYCASTANIARPVADWLSQFHHIDANSIKQHLYTYPDAEAVRHMLRVAGGLDSLILGEPQILGQVKQAYQQATEAGTLDQLLTHLFQHTFSVAKQIRTDTSIGESPVSVAFASVTLAKQIFSDFNQHTALLIGAGETIELTARHLREQGMGKMIIANRTLDHAHQLAARYGGYGIGLDEIPTHLAEADIVISSTASDKVILDYNIVKTALSKRKHRPVFMVDIAVPRDIDANVRKLDDVYLYTVDDLKEVIQENLESRQQAAEQAEEIIDIQVDRFMAWLRSQSAVTRILTLRSQAENERDKVLEQAKRQIAAGKTPEEVMQYVAHTLTNKLIHEPTQRLRKAGEDNREDLMDALMEIFKPDQES